MMKPHWQIIIFIFWIESGLADAGAQTWDHTGSFGGHITALAVNPVDINIVYAGTYGAGIFKIMDGGNNWESFNSGFPAWQEPTIGSPTEPNWWFGNYYPITLLQFNPNNPRHIYAGTYGSGIAQSADAGFTWVKTNEGLPMDSVTISALWIHPNEPTRLFCVLRYPNGGLYHSADGGLSWARVSGVPSERTYSITTINHVPGDPSTLYVGITSAGEPNFSWGLLKSLYLCLQVDRNSLGGKITLLK